jgi:hypothetical protein
LRYTSLDITCETEPSSAPLDQMTLGVIGYWVLRHAAQSQVAGLRKNKQDLEKVSLASDLEKIRKPAQCEATFKAVD